MVRLVSVAVLLGFAGCGSTIGALDGLPDGPDMSAVEWPRLVDTPEAPEARLTSGAGERAVQNLQAQQASAAARIARAEAVLPVSDALLQRSAASRARTAVPAAPAVDEAGLLARAQEIRVRAVAPRPTLSVSEAGASPLRRPVPIRPLDTPVVSSNFEERARRARERAARSGT